MRLRGYGRLLLSLIAGLLLPAYGAVTAYAQQSSSAHYQVNEVFFGAGGDLSDCSAHYCAKQSAGELGVGNTASANYQSQAGFNTDRTPYLQFIVNNGSTDLGVLSVGSTATATTTFSVKTYLAGGYTLQTVANPPTSSAPLNHQLTALTTPTASAAGTEQFGINLVGNSSPITFGHDPTQVPDNTFSFGTVASGYATPNLYKYVNGATLAASTKSSGETDYTISYIFNISNTTPAGAYTFNQVLVATSTF